MTTVLGIDAAWTAAQPSGVALVSAAVGNWRLIFAGSSYRHLLDRAEDDRISTSRPSGSVAEAAALLAAAGKIAGSAVDLVCRRSRLRRAGFRTIWSRQPMAPVIVARIRRARSGPVKSAMTCGADLRFAAMGC
ncbi:hypothetical protein ABIE78_000031 [Sinorhizobium fredii]|uniref:DUF429 domain-containing protein n=1 Tax=Sinorhizobium fredii (strain USDA 257) TaxID=1185652 RepID=I3XGA7_SINF2|nr:hypothetical protein USDA257_p01980 [Sinorhizobium fredii USDA 257]CCE99192.1 hypothetical protein SFHH103_04719 [Sinorhizobium fredii HH103]CEO91215.1 hypothetical protein SFHH103_psfHH103d_20 [Sinorhizobium fredii HH103]